MQKNFMYLKTLFFTFVIYHYYYNRRYIIEMIKTLNAAADVCSDTAALQLSSLQ